MCRIYLFCFNNFLSQIIVTIKEMRYSITVMLCYRRLYYKIKYYSFNLMDSQVNSNFMSYLSCFINEICEEEYIKISTDEIFSYVVSYLSGFK